MSRAVTMAAFAAALILAIGFPAVSAAHDTECAGTDPKCFASLPADREWEQAIRLDDMSGGWRGRDITVATIDTGVTPNPNFAGRLLARVDFTPDADGIDRFGHGTHIAGLIASSGAASNGAYVGVAPEANLVSLKVAGWDGATDVSTVIAALRWVVSNRTRYGIRIVNLSWGTDSLQPTDVDPLNAAVERVTQAGIVVVVAAGNDGAAPVSKPGDDPYVITVGAADTEGTETGVDDTVAEFSSRGTAGGSTQKPDILAPGVSLVSDRAPDSTIDRFRPEARVGSTQLKGSGTSQAAAVVSGVVARMLDANPSLTPALVKAGLMRSTRGRLAGAAGGAGLIDAASARYFTSPWRVDELPGSDGDPVPPVSNATGSLAAARGSFPVSGDADGDGTAEPLSGEVDVLGLPWDADALLTTPWTRESWAASPWAPLLAEIAGWEPAPVPAGPVPPLVAWDPAYWGADTAVEAGWDARYWGARYWGARYWGASSWL